MVKSNQRTGLRSSRRPVFCAVGAIPLAVELLLVKTFSVAFTGWSVYPLVVLCLLGGGMLYLGMNSTAREVMQRKLFF